MITDRAELKPCPFCKGPAWLYCHGAVFRSGPPHGYRVECEGECHGMTCYWHTQREAEQAWNRRLAFFLEDAS